MSLNTTIRLEPFIKIKTLKESFESEIKSCPLHGKIETDYCSECGNVSENKTILIEYHKDIDNILGNDVFWPYHTPDGYTYLFDNGHGCGFVEPEENEMTIVGIVEIERQINEFKEIHKLNIEKLQEHVKDRIVVQYGLFKHVW